MKDIRLVVLSGPSGSGKSTAIKVLEDLGYFCVDNLPVALLPTFLELLRQSGEISKAATVVDVRERRFLKDFPGTFERLKKAGYGVELIFLDASDEALLRRFSETRRRHPLSASESPAEALVLERDLLSEVRAHATEILDTSNLNVHELKELIRDRFSGPASLKKMSVNIVSFGYRYGIPTDADIVLDVRFLPNPYFVDSLKGLDGRSPAVKEFVLSKKETGEFLSRVDDFLGYLLPLYQKEGKSYLTIAVGCTGGKHRSVVIAELLRERLARDKVFTHSRHRDIEKP